MDFATLASTFGRDDVAALLSAFLDGVFAVLVDD